METYNRFSFTIGLNTQSPIYLVDVDDTLVKTKMINCPYDDKLINVLNDRQVVLFTKMNKYTIENYKHSNCPSNVNRYKLLEYLKSQNVQIHNVIVPVQNKDDTYNQSRYYYAEYLHKLEFNALDNVDKIDDSQIDHDTYAKYDSDEQYKNNMFFNLLIILKLKAEVT